MTREQYFQYPAMNQSRLKRLLTSEKHFLADDNTTTSAQSLGTLAHALVLEPDTPVRVFEGKQRRGKDWEQFLADAGPDAIVTVPKEYEAAKSMADSLLQCKFLQDVKVGAQFEKHRIWTDRASGLECKALIDLINHDQEIIVDLKTTVSIEHAKFQSDAFKFGYHIQSDFYRRAFDYAYKFVIVAVEKKPPFDFAVFTFDDDLQAFAQDTVDDLLMQAKTLLGQPKTYAPKGLYDNNGVPVQLTFPKWKEAELFNEDEDDNTELIWN